jgi:hypothetical protein
MFEEGRNEGGPGRLRPCAWIGFRLLEFFGYFFYQEKK